MLPRTERQQQLLDKGLMLESDLADGSLKKIFGPVKQNLGKFGAILSDSAKLIGSDIGFLVKLTFSRLKKLEDIKAMEDKHNQNRRKYLDSISKNSDELMNSWPDGKITSMMVAPGFFFTSSALTGVQKVTSPQFRSMVGEFGFNQVPGLDIFFGEDKAGSRNAFAALAACEPGDGECMAKALAAGGSGGGEKQGMLSKLATKINSIFLISHHELDGSLIYEGEEEEVQDNDDVQLTKEQEEFFLKELKKLIDSHLADGRKKFLEGQKKYYDKIVKEAEGVISLNSSLASTQDSKEFVEILEKLKKLGGDAVDLDVDKIKSGAQDLAKKIKDDEKSMKEIEKTFDEEKIEKTEENLNNKIEELVLSSLKSQFLVALREVLSEYYEDVYSTISGGLEKEQIKELEKDPSGKQYTDLVAEYEKKLKEALSKLEQS